MLWHLKSVPTWLFVQQFAYANIKEIIKTPITGSLWGKSASDYTEHRKHFHVMTSLWMYHNVWNWKKGIKYVKKGAKG